MMEVVQLRLSARPGFHRGHLRQLVWLPHKRARRELLRCELTPRELERLAEAEPAVVTEAPAVDAAALEDAERVCV